MAGLPSLTMMLGGAASGKSTFAEHAIAQSSAGRQMHYVATAQPLDEEMGTKIAKHQNIRADDGWITHEQPLDVAKVLRRATADQILLVDCATMWLTNHLMAGADLAEASHDLISALQTCDATVVVVTNEVGQGIVPEHAISRTFREAQGTLNQLIATEAQLVVQVIAGLPLVLKGTLPKGLT